MGEERAGESARKAVRRVERAREEEPQRARVLELVEGDRCRRERPAHPVLPLVRVRVRVRARTRVRVRVRVGLTLTLILTLTLSLSLSLTLTQTLVAQPRPHNISNTRANGYHLPLDYPIYH